MGDQLSVTDDQPGSHRLSRRTLLRAAGHAAWAVPAIQIVSTAPAFAAASDTLQITAASGTWNLPGNYVDASITVHNNSTTDPTAGLLVTLTFPNFYVNRHIEILGFPIDIPVDLTFSNVLTGWGTPTANYSGSGTSRTATAVFARTGPQLPAGTSATLTFRVKTGWNVKAVDGTDTITVVANATDFGSGTDAIDPT